MLRLVFPLDKALEITKYEVVYPFPKAVEHEELLRGVESLRRLRVLHEKEVWRLDKTLEDSLLKVDKFQQGLLNETTSLILRVYHLIQSSGVIDNIIPSTDEQDQIKEIFTNSLIEATIKYQAPSIQKILGVFINKLNMNFENKEVFSWYLKPAVLLIRWLAKENIITFTKTGRRAPYVVQFYEEGDENILKREFYNNKIFFKPEDYNPDKSQIMSSMSGIELTPVSLNHEYFKFIKDILYGIECGKLARGQYGFSLDDLSFEGELITLREGLKHYDYIAQEMLALNTDQFYYYWFNDSRGRMYPKLTNFSVQSSRILRPGFKHEVSPHNTYTREDLFSLIYYSGLTLERVNPE